MDDIAQDIKPCIHCRGTGICTVCRGTGELSLQHGMKCTQCFPKGSGWCQNCRGFGGRDGRGRPAAYGRAAAVVAAEATAREAEAKLAEEVPPAETASAPISKPSAPQDDQKRPPET